MQLYISKIRVIIYKTKDMGDNLSYDAESCYEYQTTGPVNRYDD